MGGLDALVFTAGVGENSSDIRKMVCTGLECLGLMLNQESNAASRPDTDVADRSSSKRILVIKTREDITMLRELSEFLEKTLNSE